MKLLQLFTPKIQARGFIMPCFISENENLSIGAKYLFGVLCDYARDKHYCYPSKLTLAKRIGCSLNSVRSWLKELIALGFVKAVYSKDLCRDIFYLYYPIEDEKESSENNDADSAEFDALNIDLESSNPDFLNSKFEPKANVYKTNNIPPTPKRAYVPFPKQTKLKNSGEGFLKLDKSFEELWNYYPKKEAKEAAKTLWFRLFKQNKLPSLDVLKKSIAYFCSSHQWQKQNGQFIPQLVNFLRGMRWKEAEQSALPVPTTPVVNNSQVVEIDYKKQHQEFKERELARQKEEQLQQKITREMSKAYELFKSFFEPPTMVENCVSLGIYSNLYSKGEVPRINQKQNISILEFLKTYKK